MKPPSHTVAAPPLYQRYFIDKGVERDALFREVCSHFSIRKGLYPGSFVHLNPSFYIRDMTYVDNDRRMQKFFNDPGVLEYIKFRKYYPKEPRIQVLPHDYTQPLPIPEAKFDGLFSLYAGFVTHACERYLKPNAIIVANDSHGDASIIATDPHYTLIAVIKNRLSRYRIHRQNLECYFITRNSKPINTNAIYATMKGARYTHNAYAYIFRYSPR